MAESRVTNLEQFLDIFDDKIIDYYGMNPRYDFKDLIVENYYLMSKKCKGTY